jgi:uncharacterized membrane protein YgaE (UPF0421/DUF939 family)
VKAVAVRLAGQDSSSLLLTSVTVTKFKTRKPGARPTKTMPSTQTIERLKHAAKTGLAAVLAFYLAKFLGLPESYWAAISAIIVMYSDVSQTLKASGQRLVGTAIGVSIGGAFAAVFGQHLWAFGLAVALTVLVCALLGFEEAARLAGVAVAIVMLTGHPARPWIAPLHRFLEVSFGILVAVVVSGLNWPSQKRSY